MARDRVTGGRAQLGVRVMHVAQARVMRAYVGMHPGVKRTGGHDHAALRNHDALDQIRMRNRPAPRERQGSERSDGDGLRELHAFLAC